MSGILDLPYIGEDNLPPGWHRPTQGFVQRSREAFEAGLAPTSALQLKQGVAQVTDLSAAQAAIEELGRFVTLDHPFSALGMAHNQLRSAAHGALSIFAAITDLSGLKPEDRKPGRVFINPTITPVEADGEVTELEPCFSCFVGCAVAKVRRWKTVRLKSDNYDEMILTGPPAVVAQHELHHLVGILCVDLAYLQGNPVFWVPPEVKESFFLGYRAGKLNEYPHLLMLEQWHARELKELGITSPLDDAHLL